MATDKCPACNGLALESAVYKCKLCFGATPPPASADALGEVERVARAIEDALIRHDVTDFSGTLDDATAALSAMSPAGEVERIVAWLRRDADILDSCVKMGLPTFSPTVSKHDAALKRELADAIERGDYRHD